MRAAILSIGDELVLGENVDTNASWLATQLGQDGFVAVEHRAVGDDREAIAQAVAALAEKVNVLVMTGGLGPTEDDLTRQGLRDVLNPGDSLVVDARAVEHLENWFRKRGRSMPESNQSQTLRPPSSSIIPNPHGTAPGLSATVGACRVFSLPGPPREMMAMYTDHVRPALARTGAKDVLVTKSVSSFGLGEALAAERLGPLLARQGNPVIGITSSESIITARVRSQGPREKAERLVDEVIAKIYTAWHPYSYGSGDDSLSEIVGRLLRKKQRTLATAESCTGGWLGKTIVDVPGSSQYYAGGWVAYVNAMKQKHLQVPDDVLSGGGAVSAPCAKAMARGAAQQSGADLALAITGIAGPDGGTADKPVGTVFIALAERHDKTFESRVRRFEFSGNRSTIRHRSVMTALQMLRLDLLGLEETETMLWERPLVPEAAGT